MLRKPTKTRCVLCSRIRRIIRLIRSPNSGVDEISSEAMLAELRYRRLRKLYERDSDYPERDEGTDV
jgi:hypothetical protein